MAAAFRFNFIAFLTTYQSQSNTKQYKESEEKEVKNNGASAA